MWTVWVKKHIEQGQEHEGGISTLVKKHIEQGQEHEGGIFSIEAPLHVSNVQVLDPDNKIVAHARSHVRSGINIWMMEARVSRGLASSGAIIPRPEIRKERRKPRPSFVASLGDDPISEWILTEGKATQITRISPIGGGCINHANRYATDSGSFFVKTNRTIGPSMFEGEALGLNAMYATQSIRVPKPYKVGPLPTGGSYIIMEFIEFGSSRGNQSVLGRKLAEMHKAAKSSKGFGFDVDNTIGSTPQINNWCSDWLEFFADYRLGYQLKLALDQYRDSTIYEKGQKLAKNLQPLFEGVVIEPCLLHGDLWSGNISTDSPVILDPACYYGHNEAEFGMSWCAGFGGSFYSSYFEVMPKQPGFERRRDLYMLYHYLNHYNLFGSGYRSSALSIIEDYLRMLKV